MRIGARNTHPGNPWKYYKSNIDKLQISFMLKVFIFRFCFKKQESLCIFTLCNSFILFQIRQSSKQEHKFPESICATLNSSTPDKKHFLSNLKTRRKKAQKYVVFLFSGCKVYACHGNSKNYQSEKFLLWI